MNPFEMVVLIVAIVTIGRVISAKYGTPWPSSRRDRQANRMMGPAGPDPDAERMRDEIKALKERIAVLERVITDTNSASALDREIEKLR